jgi:hypothetical protein
MINSMFNGIEAIDFVTIWIVGILIVGWFLNVLFSGRSYRDREWDRKSLRRNIDELEEKIISLNKKINRENQILKKVTNKG